MPPRKLSRYAFASASLDAGGALLLSDPEPFRYRELSDNTLHRVADGDTLFRLAGRYFSAIARPAGLWWVIADFQPVPIVDPTLALEIGRAMIIPSTRTVLELVFNEARRTEAPT